MFNSYETLPRLMFAWPSCVRRFTDHFSFLKKKKKRWSVYLDMLTNFLLPQLIQYGHDTVNFKQDGVPCHYTSDVHTFLNSHFPRKKVLCAGTLLWASQSAGLSQLGFIKDLVFTWHSSTLQELRNCITEAAAAITQAMLQNVFRTAAEIWEVCCETDGEHVVSNH